jgi:hypothetical protein
MKFGSTWVDIPVLKIVGSGAELIWQTSEVPLYDQKTGVWCALLLLK